jgi:thymidylate synthase
MAIEVSELDQMQAEYKAAVDEWVVAIRNEEALASIADHSVADIDAWEEAADAEEEAREKTKDAKKTYEEALREKFFHF